MINELLQKTTCKPMISNDMCSFDLSDSFPCQSQQTLHSEFPTFVDEISLVHECFAPRLTNNW